MAGKQLVTATCLCTLALVGASCRPADNDNEAEDSTLTILIPDQDERVLGPLGASSWFLVFLGLTDGMDDMGEHPPRLLDRWEHNSDYTEWTVHVRDNVRWGDGVPVTAEDVKFSLELWTHPDILYEYPFFDSITVLDSETLRITFKEPVSATIFTYNWLAMLPMHLLDTLDIDQIFSWPFWVQPVGNGPYRYVRHIERTMTELEVNPDYYGEPPRISRVVLRYGSNPITELLSGNVDMVSNVRPVQAARLAEDPRFRVYYRVRSRDVAIAWNHRNRLFQNADVRKALTMTIDRRELYRLLDYPEGIPIYDVPARYRHFARGMVPDPLPYSPERAAQLFARAGWIDADNDDILEKDGVEFRFTLSITAQLSAEAVYIQEQLRRTGIVVEISTYDRSALIQRMRQQDFDAATAEYNYIEQFGEFPITGYVNAEASRLRDGAWFTIDQDNHDELLRSLWRIFAAEMPITYLHPALDMLVAHRRVRGMENNMLLFPNIERLWIEDEDGGPDT